MLKAVSALIACAALFCCSSTPYLSKPLESASASDGVVYSLPRTALVIGSKLTRVSTKTPSCAALNQTARDEAKAADKALADYLRTVRPRPAENGSSSTDSTSSRQARARSRGVVAEPAAAPADPFTTWKASLTPLLEAYAKAGFVIGDLPVDGSKKYGMSDFSVASIAEADPNQVYVIEIDKKRNVDHKLSLELTALGTLGASGQTLTDSRGKLAGKIVVETVAAIGKIIGSIFGLAGGASPVYAGDEWQTTPCGKTLIELGILVDRKRETLQNLAPENAQGDALAEANSAWDARIAELSTAFTGEKSLEASYLTCVVRPESRYGTANEPKTEPATVAGTTPLFAMDPDEGFGWGQSCSGPTAYLHADATDMAKFDIQKFRTNKVNLEVSVADDDLGVAVAKATSPAKIASMHYRFPGRANVRLSRDGVLVVPTTTLSVAQFGPVQAIPALRSKTYDATIAVHADTGGMKTLAFRTAGGAAENTPEIGGVGDAVTGVLNATKTRRETQDAALEKQMRSDLALKIIAACEKALADGTDLSVCELK